MDNFSLQNWRIRVVNEDAFKEGMGELNVYEYQTNHFDMCPSAQTLFKDILRGEFTDGMPSAKEQDKIVELAKLHDTLFALEKIALKDQGDAKAVFDKVIETASDIYELATEIGLDKNVDLRYIQGHVQRVNDAARGEDEIGRPLDEDKAERMATLIKQRDALIKKHSDAGEMFSDKVYDLDSQIQKIAKSGGFYRIHEGKAELENIKKSLEKKFPHLRFVLQNDKITVRGSQQEMYDFGDKLHGKKFGEYEVWHIDDDDQGEIVQIIRSDSIHRSEGRKKKNPSMGIVRKKLGKVPKAGKVASKKKMKLPSGLVNYMDWSVSEKKTD